MERAQYVLAFDLATRTGWAKGEPSDPVPMSRAVSLWKGANKEPDGTWQYNMRALFLDLARDRMPDLVIWETPLTPEAWKRRADETGRPQNGPSLIMQNSLSDILKSACHARSIMWVTIPRQTILKHYTGHGSWTSSPKAGDGRERGKEATIRRAHALGHLHHSCRDEDRADAIALWSYGCCVYGGYVPKEIIPFEQRPMSKANRSAPREDDE